MYRLFAGMLTLRSWHNVKNTSVNSLKEGFRAQAPSPEEAKQLKVYIKQFAKEISTILRNVPRELLLLLKTNDCLRAVDHSLGAPINTYVVMARRTSRALYQESWAKATTWGERWHAFRKHARVEATLFAWIVSVRAQRVVRTLSRGWAKLVQWLWRGKPAVAT